MRSNQHIEDDYCPAETQPLETANCTMPIQCPDWVQSNWTAVSCISCDDFILENLCNCAFMGSCPTTL